MDASILIVTRDRADELKETLEAMRRVAVPAGCEVELVVVDNGSSDHTQGVVKGCRLDGICVRHVLEEKPGLSHGRNRALAESSGEVILFTDDDVRPPEDWLVRMMAPIKEGEADGVAGGVVLAPHLLRPWMTAKHKAWLASSEWIDGGKPVSMVGANMVFARRVLEKVPEFDPELGAGALGCGEEGLFVSQLLEAGFRITARLDVAMEHHCQESRLERGSWLAAAEKMGRSQAYRGHHWEHWGCRLGWWKRRQAQRRLAKWRAENRDMMDAGGCAEQEMDLMFDAALADQHVLEAKRARNYARHGLVKLEG